MSTILNKWRSVINRLAEEEDHWKAASDEVPPSFFHYFRPLGKGLDEVFQDVAYGEEIFARLKEVYDVAGDGQHGDRYDMYFIVRKPRIVTQGQLILLAEQHLERMAELVCQYDEAAKSWGDILKPLKERSISVCVTQSSPPKQSPTDYENLNAALYEVTGDFVRGLTPVKSDALLLRDALYYIACRYELVFYVIWPLYRNATTLKEPFRPWFQLWKLGADLQFEENTCRVYVPRFQAEVNGEDNVRA
jgi:hypothetical protein